MFAAVAGWRIVLADRENGGSTACPIVAWELNEEKDWGLIAWYVPNEVGIPPMPVSTIGLVCGYLAPGQEHEGYWDEVANDLIKHQEALEDREYEQQKAASWSSP